MRLTEAEIQILASIAVLDAASESTTQRDVERRGGEYHDYKEDWSGAFDTLVAKGLIEAGATGLLLTDAGRPIAEAFRKERPDLYWYQYQKFYGAAQASAAHSELCTRVFGKDLCQDGQTDMPALMHLLEVLNPRPGDKVLDLGCGAGEIAEFVAEETGANVVGLDYSGPAIEAAKARTADKRGQLDFVTGNFNDLGFADQSFDAIISLDTLYWAADLTDVTVRLLAMLKSGGRLGVFMNHHIAASDPKDKLSGAQSDLGRALARLGQPFEHFDYTAQIGEFWRRNCAVAEELKDAYESEGNGFIVEGLIRESYEDYLPDIEAQCIARYLFVASRQ